MTVPGAADRACRPLPRRGRASTDVALRPMIRQRRDGDDRAACGRLPAAIRRRPTRHADDARSVNAPMLWRRRRRLPRSLDHGERLERAAFAGNSVRRHGQAPPHEAAA